MPLLHSVPTPQRELRRWPIRALLLVPALGACITTHATLVDPTAQRYEPVPADSVRIFTDQGELDTLLYVRVAIIEASGSGEYTNQSAATRIALVAARSHPDSRQDLRPVIGTDLDRLRYAVSLSYPSTA